MTSAEACAVGAVSSALAGGGPASSQSAVQASVPQGVGVPGEGPVRVQDGLPRQESGPEAYVETCFYVQCPYPRSDPDATEGPASACCPGHWERHVEFVRGVVLGSVDLVMRTLPACVDPECNKGRVHHKVSSAMAGCRWAKLSHTGVPPQLLRGRKALGFPPDVLAPFDIAVRDPEWDPAHQGEGNQPVGLGLSALLDHLPYTWEEPQQGKQGEYAQK